ncbi:MAG: hypothetical protein AAFQ83_12390 [Bacteroidota bacterium]
MKNLFLLLSFIFFSLLSVQAQKVNEGKQEFMKKTTGNAFTITIQGQEKNVLAVLDQKFRSGLNTKPKSKSGFHYYEGVTFSEIANNRWDYYYKADRASRKSSSETRITVFVSAGNNNFLTSTNYPNEMGKLTEMMEGLQLDVKIYEMGLLISEQKKVVAKEAKVHEKMVTDSVKLEIELAETLQSIDQNKLDRKNQLQLIEQEKDRLATFKAQLAELKQGEPLKPSDKALIEEVEKAVEGDGDGK